MMFWTPCAVASWPDSGIGFSFFAFRAVDDRARRCCRSPRRPPSILLLVLSEHLLEDRLRLLVASQPRHELLRALRQLLPLEERVQDVVVSALEPGTLRDAWAAPTARQRRPSHCTSSSPSFRPMTPRPWCDRPGCRRTRCRRIPVGRRRSGGRSRSSCHRQPCGNYLLDGNRRARVERRRVMPTLAPLLMALLRLGELLLRVVERAFF